MEKFEIIPIAKKKLERRGIPQEWVGETINNPDQIVDGYGDRKVAQKKYLIQEKEYLLRIVYEESVGMQIVLTAYLTSQVKRYWKEEER